MYILSVDTTAKTAACALCLVTEEGKLFPVSESVLNSTLTHSESILPMIDFCLKNARANLSEIDVIGISAGPGSFTGVRIGISTVKGLAFANEKIKCVPVSALEALAFNGDGCESGCIICPCMDARRNQFYNSLFELCENGCLKRLCEDRAVDYKDLYDELCEKYRCRKIVLTGDGAELAFELIKKLDEASVLDVRFIGYDRTYQNGVSVAKSTLLHIDEAICCDDLSPVYLRMSQAERERIEKA